MSHDTFRISNEVADTTISGVIEIPAYLAKLSDPLGREFIRLESTLKQPFQPILEHFQKTRVMDDFKGRLNMPSSHQIFAF